MRSRSLITIFIIACLCNLGFGQNQSDIDSIKKVIENAVSPQEKADALLALSDQYSESNVDTMLILCNEALDIANENKLPEQDIENRVFKIIETEAHNNLGYYHIYKGNLDEAYFHLKTAEKIGTQIQHYEALISVGINLSVVVGEQGKYKEAIETLEKVLILTRNTGKKAEQATVLNNIGWVYQVLHSYEKSIEYFQQSAELHKSLNNDLALASSLTNLGVSYGGLKMLDSAKYYYETAYEIRKNYENPRGLSNSLSNLAGVYMRQGDSTKALEYFKQSLTICRENDFKRLWANELNAIGKLAIHMDSMELARQCITEYDSILPYYATPVARMGYYQILYRYNAALGDYDKAYQNLLSYTNIKDSSKIQSTGYELIAKEIELESEKERALLEQRHQHELALQSVESRRFQSVLFLTIGILIILLFAAIVLWRNVRQKRHIDRMQLEITRLNNEKLNTEMEQKSKELTSFSLRLAQNTQILENVDEILTNVSDSAKADIEEDLRKLKNQIKTSKRREKDWLEFQKQFEGIHTSFIQNLKQKYPDLTAKEIRLCTLLKLNLPSKDIASVLGVSMNTLKSSRYRIHKKIDLQKGENLADFILGFN